MEIIMSYPQIIEEINSLPHYREFTCKNCGLKQKVYILVIQGKCEQCGIIYKYRGFGSIGTEIEDVIDAVLEWLGTGSELEDAMNRKKAIDTYEE